MKKTTAAVLIAIASSAACAADAPACADPAVMETVQQMFWQDKLHLETVPTPADGAAWRAYRDFHVTDVITSGYDSGLHRRLCEGSMGKGGSRQIRAAYTVQVTDTMPSRVIVRADFSAFPEELAIAMREVIVNTIKLQPR